MSGRMLTIDIDSWLAKGKIVSEELPALLSVAEAAGWTGASKLSAFLPMATPVGNLLSRLAGNSNGLTAPGMPDTGPTGRGRLKYLQTKNSFDDNSVVAACESITMHGFPQSKMIADTVNFTLSCLYPDTPSGQWDNKQTRTAVDKILSDDGLSEGTCDRLGDLIYFALTHKPVKPGNAQGE